jgi:alpha-tubulin suppressor-like RCC1 family protein
MLEEALRNLTIQETSLVEDPRCHTPKMTPQDCISDRPRSAAFVWGRALFSESSQFIVDPVVFPLNFVIASVACGKDHALLVSTQNQLFSMGSNSHGQLGVASDSIQPQLVPQIQPSQVACGSLSSFALTAEGLFGWGSNLNN